MKNLGWLALVPGVVWTAMVLFGPTAIFEQHSLLHPWSPWDYTARIAWIVIVAVAVALLAFGVVVWRWARRAATPAVRGVSVLAWILAGLAAFSAEYGVAWAAAHSDPRDFEGWGWQAVMLVLFVFAGIATMRDGARR